MKAQALLPSSLLLLLPARGCSYMYFYHYYHCCCCATCPQVREPRVRAPHARVRRHGEGRTVVARGQKRETTRARRARARSVPHPCSQVAHH